MLQCRNRKRGVFLGQRSHGAASLAAKNTRHGAHITTITACTPRARSCACTSAHSRRFRSCWRFPLVQPHGVPAPGPWDLPGDVATLDNEGLAEGENIWVRLATIVRARRLDLRLLMDACDLHNRGM